ncbi:hypothetical protein LPJ73_000199 [Coemansia sp. RSA 2703]|nr:hypothetical protein LPJ73_000199 [Coemansia sp. RSA 2703]KAJ2378799.1 hypothetical protein IW150_000580 [Coemansia sp. RSA 2607]KAJ2398475.1 hypothetical protein GGI05_000067 [Coemansia sp. RSA 2603]
MGKSAKAFKRPTKKQKETRKETRKEETKVQSVAESTSKSRVPSAALSKTSGGGVTKAKSNRLKTRLAAARGAAGAGSAANKKTKTDYLKLFDKKT